MSTIGRGLGAATDVNYSLDDILRSTRSPNQPSRFRGILGGIVGGAGNIVAPGLGSAIGGLISGGGLNSTGLLGDATQFLELQRQIQAESRAFETASAVLKSRHDSSMSAIRNIK